MMDEHRDFAGLKKRSANALGPLRITVLDVCQEPVRGRAAKGRRATTTVNDYDLVAASSVLEAAGRLRHDHRKAMAIDSTGGDLTISVIDPWAGIDDEEKQKIFLSFY